MAGHQNEDEQLQIWLLVVLGKWVEGLIMILLMITEEITIGRNVISLLWKVQEAIPQHKEHHMMFKTFSETITHSQDGMECLKQWTEFVEAWEKCCLMQDESDQDWSLALGMTITASKMIIDDVHTEQLQYDLKQESKVLSPHSMNLQHAKHIYIPEIMGIQDQMDKDAESNCIIAWNIDLLLPSKLLGNKVLTCDNCLYQHKWDVWQAQVAEALAKESYGHGQQQGNKSHIFLEDCCKGKANFMTMYN
ncbi:hypothetical protein EDD18DRAFT_1106225 [Armillaria luteobubalina]|uniref:Uncharacterized protein n=1 Tax=Armillaria luteobubalina TaxID=153913 RepID=A0AA39Q3Q5_9AGAR|nr:hypothetical protein EDD18DRAFT_1106225 [Armillaria luteobubalina]